MSIDTDYDGDKFFPRIRSGNIDSVSNEYPSPCNCMGPQPGESLCPCALRVQRQMQRNVGANDYPVQVPKPWLCPSCGKGQAPHNLTCLNPMCGVKYSGITSEAS